MGLIKAAIDSVGATLADQWLEVVEPDQMSEGIVLCSGRSVRQDSRRGSNKSGTQDLITNGSAVHVYDNQAMLVVDSGRVAELSAEPGVYTIQRSEQPSVFTGPFGDSLKETFNRFKYGGIPSQRMQVFYINLQEIKNIRFGTANPLNYFDEFYNAELFLRCHGSYSIKIVDPIKFYQEAIPRDAQRVHIDEVKEQYMAEFLEALQTSINQMSVDGIRISQVASKMRELSKYMADTLDDSWRELRGIEVCSVGIASISYDEESRELLKMRSSGTMLQDPSVREGYVQGAVARGIESAGSNEAGAGAAFLGVGMGMNAAGGFMGAASASNQAQMQQGYAPPGYQQGYPGGYPQQNQRYGQAAPYIPTQQTPAPHAAQPAGANAWSCQQCHSSNTGKFCPQCGHPAPVQPQGGPTHCSGCGQAFHGPAPAFCPQCGTRQS
ncbi:MAG: SPFH domain-containing protein [Actinomycetaceae bacterium]|nr:SPFH domain-containing protein [Actinomycetaceae bacterium]